MSVTAHLNGFTPSCESNYLPVQFYADSPSCSEAIRLAFADVHAYVGDSDFSYVPVDELLSKVRPSTFLVIQQS